MIVHKLEPQGYCGGVKKAIKIAMDTAKDETIQKPIYMLGSIIHNAHVIHELETLGIITIDDKGKTRLELLDSIESGTVIFSAHGVSPNVYKKAKDKGLTIIDASCPYVLMVQRKMSEHLKLGYECIYIGTKNHPECEGVLGISDSIHFIASIEDVDNLKIHSNKVYATNQTTLSIFDTKEIFEEIRKNYPDAIIDDKICSATTERQLAMANQPTADLCIVVGDKKSSNTKKLALVSETKAKIKTILCEDYASLEPSVLNGVKTINISSGASTPSILVDEIISHITNEAS